ncbi:hypothetical protein Tsubulata_040521 [Turnera subulata]|uniref:Expansin-like EG45 domain-containing protein n=1 Tax=Turnera subulata TaxID=218843 RepID=A0A9Q0FZW6_9ROSI|nr:hypothetical protein Tsubulata_040521 [Turnera subulata]
MAFHFQNFVASILVLFLCFGTLTISAFESTPQSSATATYYTPPYVPSACYGYEDQGVMIAAASDAFYKNGEACGKYYQVTCVSGTNKGTPNPCLGSGTAVVKIVDHCPPNSCRGTIDLSQEAFASIADPTAGVINVSFKR